MLEYGTEPCTHHFHDLGNNFCTTASSYADLSNWIRSSVPNVELLQNKTGWTALHEAACNGRREVACLLLDYNADPTICTADGDTVLHKAARWNQLDIIKLLLTIGVDVSAQDNVSLITETHLPQTIQE